MEGFKTSQRIGERTGLALQDLSNTYVEGTAADGKVKVSFTGQQVPVGVQVRTYCWSLQIFESLLFFLRMRFAHPHKYKKIDETYLHDIIGGSEGVHELCSALTEAMREAQSKSASKVEDKLKSLYTDLGFEN